MAKFLRSRTLLAAGTIMLMGGMAVDADAGGRSFRRHHAVTHVKLRTVVHVTNKTVVHVRQPRRTHRDVNTYSGDVAVYYRRGVGTWSYGDVAATTIDIERHPGAKIIDLGNLGPHADCSMEKGVCVLRP